MTTLKALAVPARPEEDASLRPVPWRRMAWVIWRQQRIALGGAAAALGGLAVYVWIVGLQLHHAHAAALATLFFRMRKLSPPNLKSEISDFRSDFRPAREKSRDKTNRPGTRATTLQWGRAQTCASDLRDFPPPETRDNRSAFTLFDDTK